MPYPIHKKKVIVYTSRKVGSESLWRFVHDLDFPDEDYQDWKTTQTARRMTAPIFKPMCEDYWKVALVRDPIERLHSCYRHRVVNTTTLFRDLDPVDGETDPTRPQTPEECVRIIQGAGLEIDPSFSFFAKNLDAYAAISANLAKHVAPQSLALGDLSWYDEVLTLDRLNELGARLGQDMPHMHQTQKSPMTDQDFRDAYEATKAEYDYLVNHCPVPQICKSTDDAA